MQQRIAFRPLMAAGAAALGASIIALTPAVSNDVAEGIQQHMVNVEHRAVALADTVVNPIQSWMDLIQTTQTNLQTVTQEFLSLPFPAAQQLAANWLQFGNLYVSTTQIGANDAINYFTGPGAYDFLPLLYSGSNDLIAGNVAGWMSSMIGAFYTEPLFDVGYPMEAMLDIPKDMATNFGYAVNTLLTTGVTDFGLYVVGAPGYVAGTFGSSLQLAINSASSGDLAGAVLNLLNVPPVTLNGFINGLNGGANPLYGLINRPYAGLYTEYSSVANALAKAIVAPNSQNIVNGGSLSAGAQQFVSQFLNGWPSPQLAINQLINTLEGLFGGSNAAGAAAALSGGSVVAGLSGGLPGLSADVLKTLDPAMVTGIAGSLGPSLGTHIAGALGTTAASLPVDLSRIATTLSVDLSTLALHILSAL
ncbi:hypothetical protein [Mycobacterium malmoense]|uniref:hypothetical protein n=1 Tax=Mycobacterium malmoense TaxID=1780 RepID=UPI0008F85723|nr:hypothetical protein [Mycobacterium malmoense]OIN77974.1 hypothetical protein BMG05_25725 [Mycobacterium malmoense]